MRRWTSFKPVDFTFGEKPSYYLDIMEARKRFTSEKSFNEYLSKIEFGNLDRKSITYEEWESSYA